ncbi:protein of unknown function (plasmid) [Agrobacterium pusense]|uniref:Uncharacterized protein n=1 Tax=Agrobacterium pusense TaxID=648995 RepID=U4Q4S6_9HYPH|nr:protein of unknown function [Agrobacterium pusense]
MIGARKIPDDLAYRFFNKPALHPLVSGKPRGPARKEASKWTFLEIGWFEHAAVLHTI